MDTIISKHYSEITARERITLEKEGIVNGCGGKGSWFKPPYKIFFHASCNIHDLSYYIGWDEERRKECDLGFFDAMCRDAERLEYFLKIRYYKIRCILYYKFVRKFGRKFFNYIYYINMIRMLWQNIQEWKDMVSYNWCYIVWPLNWLQLYTGKQLTDTQYKKFRDDMKAKWHKLARWRMHGSSDNDVFQRWKTNIWDDIWGEYITLFSKTFRENVLNKIPMVVSIQPWEQFRLDREDGVLSDTNYDDKSKWWHTTVIYGREFWDSRWDQKKYSFTRQYLETVKWLFRPMHAKKVLVFKRK